ncbi:zinc-ribbon domain-containing protein, partial [Candidatus Bathyarchaeota archaeon]|nr:zinc-ribbon domain-containing protein [Candidatus Bathyarchaeota archaeon]
MGDEKLVHCEKCGAELPEGAKFCPSCGARV